MRKEVLISLGDEGLKDVAEVLGSDSCVKILDLLALKDLAVSDIARELGMKLNTTDYNVKKLVKAGLIKKSGHWWSVKGKKMPVYQVVDRRIVISPKRRIAAKFLWVLGLTGAVGIWLRSLMMPADFVMSGEKVMDDAVFAAAPRAMELVVNEVSQVEMMASNGGISDATFAAIIMVFVATDRFSGSSGEQTITVDGISEVSVMPDLVSVTFNVETLEKSANVAKDNNAEIMAKV